MCIIKLLIVCIIFSRIATPINNRIEKRIENKVLSYIFQIISDMLILLCLYGIAILLGFNIYK